MSPDPLIDIDVDAQRGGTNAFRLRACVQLHAQANVVLGPSGAGKSTLLAVVAGLLRPRAGRVVVGGAVFFDAAARVNVPVHKRRVAWVSQGLALFPHLRAEENVGYGVRDRRARATQAAVWMEKMRVTHLHGRLPHTFSGGEAQRVALARALASEPRVLLLDEPFSALDAPLRDALRQELLALAAQRCIPLLFVTHDRAEADAVGGSIVVLDGGRVVDSASAS